MKKKENILKQYEIFADDIYENTINKLDVVQEIQDLENELNKSLTEEQKQLLDKIHTKENEKQEEIYKNMFIEGFCLATKLFVEGMQD